ncbi:VWA domain-containing protein [Olivibacter sp. CPCC 100613]|uniref:vWA domain-containing protein n=1 Tax=Olivibacter sp. CPCC 100613 TaxID=3079931 RepID=UPI002FF77BA1
MDKTTYLRTKLALFISIISIGLLLSCSKDDNNNPDPDPIVEPLNDNSLPSAAILNIGVVEKTDDHVKFRMDLAVFRDSKNVEDNLKATNFIIDSLSIHGYTSLFNNDYTQLVNGSNTGDYAALMLLDQSGSISGTDPENYRLDAAKIFCSNLGTNNLVGLWSFAYSNYKQLVDFTTDTSKIIQEIEKLRDQEGGSTPLYKSQYEGVTYAKDKASKPNKAVLTFTDGEDTEYGLSAEDVVNHAKNQGVKLYNIGLGDVSSESLLKQAVATNGGFMYAKDARQLISIFGNLGKLLTNTAIYYQTEWTIKSKGNDKIFSGQGEIAHELKITFPYGGEITVPFSFDYE